MCECVCVKVHMYMYVDIVLASRCAMLCSGEITNSQVLNLVVGALYLYTPLTTRIYTRSYNVCINNICGAVLQINLIYKVQAHSLPQESRYK